MSPFIKAPEAYWIALPEFIKDTSLRLAATLLVETVVRKWALLVIIWPLLQVTECEIQLIP